MTVEHSVTVVGGKVPADERLRLVNIHGADKAAAIIEQVEAAHAAPVVEEPTEPKGKAKAASQDKE